ncbi:MAG: S8 family serine peptidase, partial [Blastocatellia bacterium]
MKPIRFIYAICLLALLAAVFCLTPRGNAQKPRRKAEAQPVAGKQSAARAARRRQLAQRGNDPRVLLTRAAIFDPLTETPAPLRIGDTEFAATAQAKVADATTRRYFIIQYQRTIQPAWTDALRAQGVELTGYLPNNAYIVKATDRQMQQARASSGVRWIGEYGAGLKVAPELADAVNGTAEPLTLSFLTFPNEDDNALREFTSLALETRDDARTWGVVTVPRAELAQTIAVLANLDAIEWIEERRPHRLHNDNVVRAVQTGFAGNDTPLYRNGLTGAGQVFGIADSGLDADHSQFRLDGNSSSQTLSLATTSADLVNGLLLQRITNQNNKVLSYFLLGSSSTKEQKDNPNGQKTLDPDRKNGTRFLNAVAYDDDGQNYHGTLTTSVAAGRNYGASGSGVVPGIATRSAGDGVAPDARIVFQDIGHPSGQLPGADWVSQTLIHRQAYGSGARVHNNSYGPAPPAVYDQDAADVDDVMWRLRDYTIFFSAGNNSLGDYQVTNAAKNNLVIGACESPTGKGNVENLLRLSNHGPTFDGRIKPDLIAPGTVIGATEREEDQNSSSYGAATSATAKDAAVNADDPNNNSTLNEDEVSGTSFASAAAAGSALLARQYFTDGFYPGGARSTANTFNPSNALIKAVMLIAGRNMTGRNTGSNYPLAQRGALPNAGQGWGRLALDDALYFAGDRRELRVLADIWNGATAAEGNRPAPNPAITTGQTHTYQLTNVSNVEALRITLAWSDPRAAVGAVIALVNNLNLEVTDPQGRVFRGNANFSNAWSQPANDVSFDDRNPIEAVYIERPLAGAYTVRVIGANVPGNGLNQIVAQPGDQRIDSNKQGYALIATGNFTAGAQPVLNLAATRINGGVNADRFVSRNETVNATLRLDNVGTLAAQNVTAQLAVDEASEVPARLIRINGNEPGAAATLMLGDLAAGATRNAAFQITLLDDGENRVGQQIRFRLTTTPAGGVPLVSHFVILAQLKLVTYRTRFEPAPEQNAPGLIAIRESDWRLREDDANRADDGDLFHGKWALTTADRASRENSTASLADPSGAGAGYGVSKTSRGGGQVFDDTRWWTPKLPLPGLFIKESTGLIANPEAAALLRAEVDSFAVDVKADFTGDFVQSSSSGDFLVLRVRPYKNSFSVRSADDAGLNEDTVTNLLYLDAGNVREKGFVHYEGDDFPGGDGVFHYEENEDDADLSDVSFRIELQFRRNGFPQTGDGVFVDNLVLRLRVADTNVYAVPSAAALTTVNAASYERPVAPGQIVAAFGSGFPAGANINAIAAALPLPAELAQTAVKVDGVAAPLFFVGVGGAFGEGKFQINYQLPFETIAGTASVEVFNDGKLIASEYLRVSPAAPGVFTADASGQGQA